MDKNYFPVDDPRRGKNTVRLNPNQSGMRSTDGTLASIFSSKNKMRETGLVGCVFMKKYFGSNRHNGLIWS